MTASRSNAMPNQSEPKPISMEADIRDPLPQPPGRPITGNIKEIKQDFFNTFIRWHQDYGDLVKFRLGPKKFYLLSHPNLAEAVLVRNKQDFNKIYNPKKPRGLALVLGQGLVTSDGPLWQQQRRLIQPMFYKSHIATMIPTMNQVCAHMIDDWRKQPTDQPMDIPGEMTRVTLDIITRTMFSCGVREDVPWLGPALKFALFYAQSSFFNPLSLPLWVPTAKNRKMKSIMAQLTQLVTGLLEQRRQSVIESANTDQDLLDLLMQAKDAEGQPMSDQQIIDECLTIFNAGHETTANALSWTLYLLSEHPAVLATLRQEVEQVLQDRDATLPDLSKLVYCEAVIEESMRRYPPVVALLRKARRDTEICGYPVEKDSIVFVNIRNIHHHHRLWSNPMTFDPDRFLPENKSRIAKLAYIPFGLGHRVCIGNHMAMMEAKVILSQIVRTFDFSVKPGHKVTEQLSITLQPKFGIPMYLKPISR